MAAVEAVMIRLFGEWDGMLLHNPYLASPPGEKGFPLVTVASLKQGVNRDG